MYQIRTEQIELVIQRDKLAHQVVLHFAVHLFIVPTVAVTRLAVYNVATTTSSGYHFGSMHRSTVLTLFLLPVLYEWIFGKADSREWDVPALEFTPSES